MDGLKGPVKSDHPVKSIRLVPSAGGVFDVRVDGGLVFSKHEAHRHAEPDEILQAVKVLLKG